MQLLRDIPEESVCVDDVWMARPFDRVPDHLLVSLLRHLNVLELLRAEGVCRRWRRLAIDAAWTHVHAIDYDALVKDGSLSAAPSPRMIIWQGQQQQAIGLLKAVVKRVDLYELNFTGVNQFYPGNKFVLRVCSLCPPLTTLNLSRIHLAHSTLCVIGSQLGGHLRSLTMQFCFTVYVDDCEPSFGSLFTGCTNLQRLDISNNCHVTGSSSFAALPVTLKSLNLYDLYDMSDAALRSVFNRCGALEELQLGKHKAIMIAATIQQLLGQLGSLRSFKFIWYYHDAENIGMLFTAVGRLANVQHLDLFHNSFVCDQTLTALASGCKQLHTVVLSMKYSPSLTDAGIGALARLPNLTRLDLSFSPSMTDAPLIAIANNGKLEVLIVYECRLITDAALQRVASCCEGLRGLNASKCPLVGDATLFSLLELVQRRATADLPLRVWLNKTAVTRPVAVAHPNLHISFNHYDREMTTPFAD